MVFFSWPSDNVMTLIPHVDVCMLGRRSALNGFYLAQLIANTPQHQRLCLLGHSHGCRIVSSSLHLIAGGQVQGYQLGFQPGLQRRIRVVFTAAALDHDWLNPDKRYGRALRSVECLLSLRSRHDLALGLYPMRTIVGSRALARSGFTSKDRRLMGWQSDYVRELDVSHWLGTHHTWPHYLARPEIAAAISPYVYFD